MFGRVPWEGKTYEEVFKAITSSKSEAEFREGDLFPESFADMLNNIFFMPYNLWVTIKDVLEEDFFEEMPPNTIDA